MSASILPPRKIKFRVEKMPRGFRAYCDAFPNYSRPGDTEEEAAWELEKVIIEKLREK